MNYDGVVAKIFDDEELADKFFLFLKNPITSEIMDGINISEHQNIYGTLEYNNLMVVSVVLKDGTMELDDVDLEEFIHGDKYGRDDIFLYIQDIILFTIKTSDNPDVKIYDLLKKGDFSKVANDCIQKSVLQTNEIKKN